MVTLVRLAFDDAPFEEGKHPRANNGQFAKTAGGGPSAAQGGEAAKPAGSQAQPGAAAAGTPESSAPIKPSTQLRAILGAGGFKKIAGSHPSAFINADGVKVVLHPPQGTAYSGKFTASKAGKEDFTGEGAALAKLLRIAIEKAPKKEKAPL